MFCSNPSFNKTPCPFQSNNFNPPNNVQEHHNMSVASILTTKLLYELLQHSHRKIRNYILILVDLCN